MSDYDNNGKGALWLRTAKSGVRYMSGEFEIDGVKYRIAVFKNERKQKENQPDYNLSVERDKRQPSGRSSTPVENVFSGQDAGVPF